MATKTESVTIERLPLPVTKEPKAFRLTIDLTLTEAEDILRLCQYIGGNPEETRGVFDELHNCIRSMGVNLPLNGIRLMEERRDRRPSGLTFTDYVNRANYAPRDE